MKRQTLHMCNYATTHNIDFYMALVEPNDAIIFYAKQMDKQQQFQLIDRHKHKCTAIYFIIDDNKDNLQTIDYSQWVELINTFERSFTWK